jgi:hypothetical protein
MSEENSSFKEKLQDAYGYVAPAAQMVILTGCAVVMAIGAYQTIKSLGASGDDLASGFMAGAGELMHSPLD